MTDRPGRSRRISARKSAKGWQVIIAKRSNHGALIVAPEGRIDSSVAHTLEKALVEQIRDASGRVLLDARRLAYMSSAGLRAILVAAREAKKSGHVFGVFGLQPAVAEIFEVTGFRELIPVAETEAEAMLLDWG